VTLGSLFDGSGTAPLAARMCGIEPIWCSEIEPFPIAVTRARFPGMKHCGNICEIDGATVEPVDIICGGSPCQDLSVAGKRAGLEGGERSVLFHEQIRIIKEMRNADKLRCERLRNSEIRDRDNAHVEGGKAGPRGNNRANGIRPRFAIWENVPGAFSSNKGKDFRCVLEAFCQVADETADVPRPAEGRWAAAGCIVGNGWSVAWRTLDAQYFGVPQRRRRIFLVADFGSECAAEILSEQGSVFGGFTEGGETRESATGKIEGGVGEAVGFDGYNQSATGETLKSLTSVGTDSDHIPIVCYESHPNDSRITECKDGIMQTLSGRMGTSGGNTPIVPQPICYGICSDGSNSMLSDNPNSGIYIAATSRTLDGNGGNPACNQGGIAVVEPSVYENHQFGGYREGCGTLKAAGGDYGGGSENIAVCRDIVRRLTPTECAKLQGFPPDWCSDISVPNPTESDISFWQGVWDTYQIINGKKPKSVKQIVTRLKHPHSDSAEYKMWGNGMALPCVLYIMRGIISAERPII
jgi:DNA (cytosine-5)-methyltransferase 1